MESITNYTDYWRAVVSEDFDDCIKHKSSLRRAFHCAVSLSHMADWVFFGEEAIIRQQFTFLDKNGTQAQVGDEGQFAVALSQLLPEFAVIRGVATSAKHFKLRQPTIQRLKAHDQDAPTSPANTFFQEGSWGASWGGTWGRSWGPTPVQIEGTGGNHRNFNDVASKVRTMWVNLAAQHGWQL